MNPYEQDGVSLINGDCLDVLREMDESSVDAVVTDPPYFLPAAHYSVRRESAKSLSDLSMLEHFFRSVYSELNRVLKPSGFLYAFCDGQSYPVFYVTAYPHFRRVRPLIWDKVTSFNGYAWRHQHEIVMFAEGVEAPHVKTGSGDILRARAVPIKEREHLAEKPVGLLRQLIEKTTPPGGVVLDPFAGSGSTLLAARDGGFRAVGIEAEPRYCEIAVNRLSAESLTLAA